MIVGLGAVHGEVSVVNDFLGRCTIVRDHSSADRGADLMGLPSNANFTFQARNEAYSDLVSSVSLHVVGENCELIASQPCQKITRSTDGLEALYNDL